MNASSPPKVLNVREPVAVSVTLGAVCGCPRDSRCRAGDADLGASPTSGDSDAVAVIGTMACCGSDAEEVALAGGAGRVGDPQPVLQLP